MLKQIAYTAAIVGTLAATGYDVLSSSSKTVEADTSVKTITTQSTDTLKAAVNSIVKYYETNNPNTDPSDIWWDTTNYPDSTRVLKVDGGFLFTPAGQGVGATDEDENGKTIKKYNLDTDPNSVSLGEIRTAYKAALAHE